MSDIIEIAEDWTDNTDFLMLISALNTISLKPYQLKKLYLNLYIWIRAVNQ